MRVNDAKTERHAALQRATVAGSFEKARILLSQSMDVKVLLNGIHDRISIDRIGIVKSTAWLQDTCLQAFSEVRWIRV